MSDQNTFQQIYQQLKKDAKSGSGSIQNLDALDNQRLKSLYFVSKELNTILDVDYLYKKIVHEMVKLLNVEHAVIIVKEGEKLEIKIGYNLDEQSRKNAIQFSSSIVKKVMSEVKPMFSKNALEDKQYSQIQTIHNLEILSFICVPILVGAEVIGTIYIDNRRLANVYNASDVEFLQAFANLIGVSIQNSRAYKEIEDLNRSLEEKVRERTFDLQKSIEQLKEAQERLVQSEKMAGLGIMIAGFIHEFNNPISFIYSNLPHLESYVNKMFSLIDDLIGSQSDAERLKIEEKFDLIYTKNDLIKLLSAVKDGAARSREVVTKLHKFTPGRSGESTVLDWGQIIDRAVKLFKMRSRRKIEFEVTNEKNMFVSGNIEELEQALMNILQNAADAGSDLVSINNTVENSKLVCSISDNGSGIPPEKIPHIFDPFYTTKEVGSGMGLGLSIVYSTIIKHRGNINASSKICEGTIFEIRLPLADA